MLQIVVQVEKGMVHPKGHPTGLQVPNHLALFKNLPAVLSALGPETVNVYYTLAHHGDLGKPKPSRSEASFEYQTVLPFDLDHVDLTKPYEYLDCVAKLLAVDRADLTLICTGNGLHVLANLATPIRSAKYQKELKPAYNELLTKLLQMFESQGLPGKPDPVVFDAGRVFRLPGTTNRKPGLPDKQCELLQHSEKILSIDITALSGIEKIQRENVSPDTIRRQYPKPDFAEMVKECKFMDWALANPDQLHEPQVFDLFSLLSPQSPASKIEYQGREMTAREVGQHLFDNASASKSLKRQDFDRKWEDSARYGARKCQTIESNMIGACSGCPHQSKITTPLALRSKDFIASDDLGFWVLGQKGSYLHPHYGDLSRVFSREQQYVTTEDERVFVFQDTHYVEAKEMRVMSWLEKKVNPADPLRAAHRSEFVKKVQVVGAVSRADEQALFDMSTLGKLNCKNGVVDIVRGELLPHDHKIGFKYVLPYDFEAEASSEFFMDWLDQVMESRVELMEAILDVMAYCLWPNYDDHVFTYLTGEGANGKGTLLHILMALVGKDNYSAVSLPQLGTNRFAPAALEGKLVNLSEESSGYEMTYEELNVIKNLSAGGDIMAERKGVQGFTFTNRAKLIFSANKTPRFKEQGHAIRRRMLAIPFDHTFKNPDPRVEQRLLSEVPGIAAMLVRRIQDNVKSNGRFVVSRGGRDAYENQQKILNQGNNVVEWANERIESRVDLGENTYISVSDAYADYSKWAMQNNYKPSNKGHFGASMVNGVLTAAIGKESKVVKVAGKPVRVYPMTRFKEGEL